MCQDTVTMEMSNFVIKGESYSIVAKQILERLLN